jgi:hypothetical protein
MIVAVNTGNEFAVRNMGSVTGRFCAVTLVNLVGKEKRGNIFFTGFLM